MAQAKGLARKDKLRKGSTGHFHHSLPSSPQTAPSTGLRHLRPLHLLAFVTSVVANPDDGEDEDDDDYENVELSEVKRRVPSKVLCAGSGWQPISLNDLIISTAVKKAYYKVMLCVHPDKVQHKGANVLQKYIAENVFDLLNVLDMVSERVYDVDAMNNGQVVGTIEKDVKGHLYPTIVAHIHNEE
ncbi:hypothetical protein L1987_06590 [Smallanthus sonchifolius]|uniref:Uncharacterized protein n=1 Tax=Smallanthus sonchifolius TaxID=185202 RepID=A0ACB9JYN0_9ASTR|nr:hypothetical protein L1987_06590 [Smallanthus sonchifolius]